LKKSPKAKIKIGVSIKEKLFPNGISDSFPIGFVIIAKQYVSENKIPVSQIINEKRKSTLMISYYK